MNVQFCRLLKAILTADFNQGLYIIDSQSLYFSLSLSLSYTSLALFAQSAGVAENTDRISAEG